MLNSSVWPIDGTQSGSIIPGKSSPGSGSNERYPRFPKVPGYCRLLFDPDFLKPMIRSVDSFCGRGCPKYRKKNDIGTNIQKAKWKKIALWAKVKIVMSNIYMLMEALGL